MKYYENKKVVLVLQIVSMIVIAFIKIELIFKLMLLFGYFFLFWQKRWHKHLAIMLIMLLVIMFSTYTIVPHS